jgi:3-isopropylmalate dehydrogenase
MRIELAVLPGDGIGPEVTAGALRVLGAVAQSAGHTVEVREYAVGWASARDGGDPLPQATLDGCVEAGAVLLGAVGHPDADRVDPERRPEHGLLRLRRELGCFANLRPAMSWDALVDLSPLRPAVLRGTDLIFVRELSSGIYYGESSFDQQRGVARSTMEYTRDQIERVTRVGFDLARQRRRSLISVDKANVLAVSRLWRITVDAVAAEYADVSLRHMLVDRAAMELVLNPRQFDVVLTGNLFGDILSDQAAALTGSLGTLASASIGGRVDLYEPVHGSAPDIAGLDVANPMGAILSVGLMLRHTFGLEAEAAALEEAVRNVLARGLRTRDLTGGDEWLGCGAFADEIAGAVALAAPAGAEAD